MARTALTLRIDEPERDALRRLSNVEGRPINELVIEAIRSYLGQKSRTLEAHLKTLRKYRRKDPKFRRAIAAFVETETSQKDPLEGEPVESDTDHPSQPNGELQSKLRKVRGG